MARRNDHFRIRLLGLALALVAWLGQVAAATACPPCCQDSLPALGEICGLDHAASPAGPATPDRHQHDCAVCPLCAAMVSHVAVLGTAPPLPTPPAGLLTLAASPPPARGPPATPYRPGRPRGPPVQA